MRLSTFLCLALAAGLLPAQQPKKLEDKKGKPNLLAKESSPYLLQHAYNPVAWRPWGKEAFESAKKENKLVFLSIGYSACHWCHVMEKESFANDGVAKILNDNFICIKVDREERPEVDEVYMTALHTMEAQGGWPLSMFLTAEGKPIIGGTYWPREDREIDGRKINGFKSVLNIIIGLQKDKPKDVAAQADHFAEATKEVFARASRRVVLSGIDAESFTEAFREYKDRFDPLHGGTGQSGNEFRGTKFPTPSTWLFLLKYGRQAKNETASKMVHTTLRKMAEGGIYDQLGGGFHRYSTERTWTVPHFEKMLYDNAQLLELYSLAYQDNKDPLYAEVVKQTVAYIEREMLTPEGIFYSALDADSEDEEGRCYVWSDKQIDEILAEPSIAAIFKTRFGVTGKPNFESKEYILRVAMDWKELAERFNKTVPEVKNIVSNASAQLLKVREKRVKPFKDTKSITGWNGQMIAGLAMAASTFEKLEWQALAAQAAKSLLKHQRGTEGRLLRIRAEAEGKMVSRLNASLDDYAFLVHGLLNLHDGKPESVWLEQAKALTAEAVKHFGDDKAGGFYFSPNDESLLFTRVKDVFDNAQPAANNVMIRNLFRLAAKTKDNEMRELADRGLKQASAILKAAPTAAPVLLDAAMEFSKPAKDQPKESKTDKPVKTADVVNAKAAVENDTIVLSVEIGKGWHLYANPVGNGMLAAAATKVTLMDGDKEVEAKIEYPKGDEVKDEKVGDYMVYKGSLKITLSGFKPGELKATMLKVKCQACSEGDGGRCLLPGTISVVCK